MAASQRAATKCENRRLSKMSAIGDGEKWASAHRKDEEQPASENVPTESVQQLSAEMEYPKLLSSQVLAKGDSKYTSPINFPKSQNLLDCIVALTQDSR